jgi:hypothetical protein
MVVCFQASDACAPLELLLPATLAVTPANMTTALAMLPPNA